MPVEAQFNPLSKPYPRILSWEHTVQYTVNADKDAVRGVCKITKLINKIARKRMNFSFL